MKSTIYFTDDQKLIPVNETLEILVKQAINHALEYEKVSFISEVSFTFTDNEKIKALNNLYRGIDRSTDVLSFPTGDSWDFPGVEQPYPIVLGDIVLSLEKAALQAEEYGHSLEREVCFLAVHSTLHLLGYDHETSEEDEKEMFARQNEIMKTLEGKAYQQ